MFALSLSYSPASSNYNIGFRLGNATWRDSDAYGLLSSARGLGALILPVTGKYINLQEWGSSASERPLLYLKRHENV